MTNQFVDTYLTNGAAQTQLIERIITQPDFLFTVADLQPNAPILPWYSRTGTANWINNATRNGKGPPPNALLVTFNPGAACESHGKGYEVDNPLRCDRGIDFTFHAPSLPLLRAVNVGTAWKYRPGVLPEFWGVEAD